MGVPAYLSVEVANLSRQSDYYQNTRGKRESEKSEFISLEDWLDLTTYAWLIKSFISALHVIPASGSSSSLGG